MESLQDLVVTTQVVIELADEAIAEAKQARQSLQAKRQKIRELAQSALDKYPLL